MCVSTIWAHTSAIPGNEKRTKVVNLSNPNSWNTNARTIRDFLVRLYASVSTKKHEKSRTSCSNLGREEFFLWICGSLIRILFIKLITWSRENIIDHFWFKTLLQWKEKEKRRKDCWKIMNFFFKKILNILDRRYFNSKILSIYEEIICLMRHVFSCNTMVKKHPLDGLANDFASMNRVHCLIRNFHGYVHSFQMVLTSLIIVDSNTWKVWFPTRISNGNATKNDK